MKNHLYSILKAVIGWPLTLVAIFFIGKILYDQAPVLLPHLKTLDPLLVFYGTISFIFFYFLRSLIWYRIVRQFGTEISFKDSSYLWSISELKRYIPGSVWSFLGRAVLFNKRGVDKKDIARGLIIEGELFVIGCFVVSLLSLPFIWPNYSEAIGWTMSLLVAAGCIVYAYNAFLRRNLTGKYHAFAMYLFPAFRPGESLLLITISTAALLFFGLGNYFVMSAAFTTDPQLLPQLIGVFALAFVAGYLSVITPAGFGVREGIVIFALTKIVSSGLAAFAAVFTRVMLIVSELLFILISYLWFKTKNEFITKCEKWLAARPHEGIVFVLSTLYVFYIATISMLRYDNYYTGRFDLGNMVQTVWTTLHGNFFMLTNPNGTENVSRLAFHADFILVLLAPIYALWQDPRMLLIIQAVVVAAGAFFIYYISRDVLKTKNLALVMAFAYLINPSIQRANLYDFHAVTLATTLLLAAFYYYLKKQYIAFIIFAVLAAFCKEQIWLIVALFGPLMFFHHKKKVLGSAIFIVGAGMFYYLLWHAIPNALGSQHFALEYYADYGDSPSAIVKAILFSPDKIFFTVLEEDRMHFLTQLFSPLGYVSLLFPFFLIFAGPDLIISLLSNNAQLHQIYYQYTATMSPFIFLSAIYGLWVLKKLPLHTYWKRNQNAILIMFILANAVYTAYAFGPIPGSNEPNLDMITKPFPDRAFIDNYLKTIPQDARVSASNNLASHLSQREYIYVTPLGIKEADIVLVHYLDPQADQTLDEVNKDATFTKVVDRNGFWVFKKN